ncbi:DUF6291 domain-containing protein [uncultured Ruminococcus sp.]|uniref:DUF6291 domain-containing protein n=1 Tax=uncultured Ruminococcus sp. TaxID=165186 RepID=UPI002664E6A3|nr:DUF6291 domain-containing protein [uncultured Ruminococcus sp.]
MAKDFHTDNKAFMLYKDWEDIFQALDSSEEIGELVMALFAYAKRGETPKLSGGAKIAFLMMRAAIERDGIAWEEMCAQRSECGKKGGRPKKSDESENTDEKVEQSEPEQADTPTDKAEEKPQGKNDISEKPKAFSETKRFLEKAKKADKDKDIDKDKEKDIDREKDTEAATSVVQSFGTHKNVMLTSGQYYELEDRCMSVGLSLDSYISKLSEWLFAKGKRCTDPYRIISNWLDKDSKGKAAAKPKDRPSSDLSWYEDYAMNFDLSKNL